MSLGQITQSRGWRFAGMLAGIAATFGVVGCGQSESRDSVKPTSTVTLGNDAAPVEPAASESKKLDADVVPASNELKSNDAELKSNESAATESLLPINRQPPSILKRLVRFRSKGRRARSALALMTSIY